MGSTVEQDGGLFTVALLLSDQRDINRHRIVRAVDTWSSLPHKKLRIGLFVAHDGRVVTAKLHVGVTQGSQGPIVPRVHVKGALRVPCRADGVQPPKFDASQLELNNRILGPALGRIGPASSANLFSSPRVK
jgi:hypothetical protein